MSADVKCPVALAAASRLAPLPRPLAGQFVGTVSGSVVVAGGTWWTAPPAEGGRKVWTDRIYVLDPSAPQWRDAGTLPVQLAYGASISSDDALILAGGQTSAGVSPFVLRLRLDHEGRAETSLLPALPAPAANISGAVVNGRIYLAGGQETADAGEAAGHFWSLEARSSGHTAGWRVERTWPGPGRILAAVAGCGDSLYLMGGASLRRQADGSVIRQYLRDAFRFHPREGWKRIADLPLPSVAAPAVCWSGVPLLLGGDDGSLAGVKLAEGVRHPGFNPTVLAHDSRTNRWQSGDRLPEALVTTGAAVVPGGVVIPGGEDRPGSRSAAVWKLEFSTKEQ